MQYMLLIYSDEAKEPVPGTDEFNAYIGDFEKFSKEVEEKGVFIAGEALQPIATATTVRVRGDNLDTTDGPFAETKEMLGGYYLLECENLDEAIDFASRIPSAKHGCVEVRPIMTFS